MSATGGERFHFLHLITSSGNDKSRCSTPSTLEVGGGAPHCASQPDDLLQLYQLYREGSSANLRASCKTYASLIWQTVRDSRLLPQAGFNSWKVYMAADSYGAARLGFRIISIEGALFGEKRLRTFSGRLKKPVCSGENTGRIPVSCRLIH